MTNRAPRHSAMVDFMQYSKRETVVLEEDHLKVEKELARVTAQRDAILLQAQTWACEAKAQRSIVHEVGDILGGIPSWGPIAAGVEALRKDAGRYRALREMNWCHGPLAVVADPYSRIKLGSDCPSRDRLDEAIDAAMVQEVKP
ncbi:hypothetical protein NNO07_18755 [Pseudomonas resinovorans]|uniref:Uncharacterized protein n=1 Tax=Metapseudomonas resinovorans TaxID=53412 RepID=A0ABT4Y8M0_METRE|nr:hypothetical protein [Pseudomonas resinovorans]MDA8485111.1 hypothetical protein [Pseudomonas resinovorans]